MFMVPSTEMCGICKHPTVVFIIFPQRFVRICNSVIIKLLTLLGGISRGLRGLTHLQFHYNLTLKYLFLFLILSLSIYLYLSIYLSFFLLLIMSLCVNCVSFFNILCRCFYLFFLSYTVLRLFGVLK